ncbi:MULTISPECIES: acyl-CoA dehydrogenase family protein [unclassified Streptomyces]|uniref:Acyl-CoA dehydrogenase family protein n=1 Tax=Streptomyces sp. NBC_00119 TaxID=2975659 RepID=A0AAU1UEQ5_9ACTN|nr:MULTISPECIES: acyl-CoA dehydrogenase family protein [unclassified Streptomyces]MCX4645747.1 acyl-CoA dehydrogenase family protein [Streptomyces sp. NBC_01446]MCX5318371.1 acyl-CoA dehydrogenase family protein [Streptomyces sp. NBC_00120]
MNYADRDPALRPFLDRVLSADDRARVEPLLTELGALAAGDLDRQAALADANPPRLVQYAPGGERVDEIEYHPAHDRAAAIAYEEFGLAAMSHRPGVHGWPSKVPHTVKYALSYLYVQSEFGMACPLSMTDSAARILRLFDPERYAAEIAALSSTDPGLRATGAMFMTEKQGGTDVGLTETVACDQGTHWTLTGKKWFASNPGADVILTLARVPGQGEGTRGLGMFLVPRLRPDGTRNAIRIDRLKDKLGSKSIASGEVTLEEAYATSVGQLTHGFRQMAEMLNVSRLSNAMRATALMRRAVRESVDHTRVRHVFGKPLFEQPLMRTTLLPMIIDTEGALALVLEAAARLTAADEEAARGEEGVARELVRVLTPLAKHTLCKRARTVTGEAMEIRGGNGYIEDWVNPRLVRDAHLGSIWEGSSNVIALDVLRCMRRQGAHRTLADTYGDRAETRGRWELLRKKGDALLELPADEQEMRIGRYADELTRAVMETLLYDQAAHETETTGNGRALLVARTCTALLDDPDTPPRAALDHLAELAEGGRVAPTPAQETPAQETSAKENTVKEPAAHA